MWMLFSLVLVCLELPSHCNLYRIEPHTQVKLKQEPQIYTKNVFQCVVEKSLWFCFHIVFTKRDDFLRWVIWQIATHSWATKNMWSFICILWLPCRMPRTHWLCGRISICFATLAQFQVGFWLYSFRMKTCYIYICATWWNMNLQLHMHFRGTRRIIDWLQQTRA